MKGTEEALKNELGKAAAKGVANVQQPDINEVNKQLFRISMDFLIFFRLAMCWPLTNQKEILPAMRQHTGEFLIFFDIISSIYIQGSGGPG